MHPIALRLDMILNEALVTSCDSLSEKTQTDADNIIIYLLDKCDLSCLNNKRQYLVPIIENVFEYASDEIYELFFETCKKNKIDLKDNSDINLRNLQSKHLERKLTTYLYSFVLNILIHSPCRTR